MFNPQDFIVGGVSLIVLVFGLVEFIKTNLNLTGKAVTVLSAALGAVLFLLNSLQEVLPAPYADIYTIAIQSVTFGLAASGYYKFINERIPKGEITIQ